jgi:hypothetical protein
MCRTRSKAVILWLVLISLLVINRPAFAQSITGDNPGNGARLQRSRGAGSQGHSYSRGHRHQVRSNPAFTSSV